MVRLLGLLRSRQGLLNGSVMIALIRFSGRGIHRLRDIFWHRYTLLSFFLFLVVQGILMSTIIAVLLPLLRLMTVRRRLLQVLDLVG
jgi:hypothetical protein